MCRCDTRSPLAKSITDAKPTTAAAAAVARRAVDIARRASFVPTHIQTSQTHIYCYHFTNDKWRPQVTQREHWRDSNSSGSDNNSSHNSSAAVAECKFVNYHALVCARLVDGSTSCVDLAQFEEFDSASARTHKLFQSNMHIDSSRNSHTFHTTRLDNLHRNANAQTLFQTLNRLSGEALNRSQLVCMLN